MTQVLEKPFEAFGLIKSASDAPEGNKYLEGPAGLVEEDSLGRDFDGDHLTKAAIEGGLITFERLGANVDWDHMWAKTRNPSTLIGRGVGIRPNPSGGAPLVKTELFMRKELAKAAWEHYECGGNLAYSLQGVATAHDPKVEKRVTGLNITMMTLTPMPKGYEGPRVVAATPSLSHVMKSLTGELTGGDLETWEGLIASPTFYSIPAATLPSASLPAEKALITGGGVVQAGDMGGAALRTQDLQGACEQGATKKRRRRKKRRPEPSLLEKAMGDRLGALGASHPGAIAALLASQMRR